MLHAILKEPDDQQQISILPKALNKFYGHQAYSLKAVFRSEVLARFNRLNNF